MIRFDCDYTEGCHPRILEALAATNAEQHPGYGTDVHCARARELIRAAVSAPDADVHFLVGGTQTNTVIIAAALRPWEGVLSAESGHIAAHETGAIESGGHKVLPLPHTEGKLAAEDIRAAVARLRADPNAEHIVQPGLVYISQPTEYGTLYTRGELEAISAVCREAGLPLFLDGARLGYALAAAEDLTLPDYARLTDVFYIGGTKLGCLFAATALRIRAALLKAGLPLTFDSPTNQLFVTLTRAQSAALERDFALGHWDATGGETDVLRICTSWATTEAQTDALIAAIRAL